MCVCVRACVCVECISSPGIHVLQKKLPSTNQEFCLVYMAAHGEILGHSKRFRISDIIEINPLLDLCLSKIIQKSITNT